MPYKSRIYVNPMIDGKISKCQEDRISKNVWHENITIRDQAAHEKFCNRNSKTKTKKPSSEDARRLQQLELIMPRH